MTDRTRLVHRARTFEETRRAFERLTQEAVEAGADLIQIREPDASAADLARLVNTVLSIARNSRTRVVVNDRLDVALACGADGVHLRADSISPSAARSIAPARFLIGRSVHTVDEAVIHRNAVDYLIAGTVFPTMSKPDADRLLGRAGLAEIASAVTVPVLAIGGVTMERLPEVAATGAAGIAAIGLFLSSSVPIRKVVRGVREQFHG